VAPNSPLQTPDRLQRGAEIGVGTWHVNPHMANRLRLVGNPPRSDSRSRPPVRPPARPHDAQAHTRRGTYPFRRYGDSDKRYRDGADSLGPRPSARSSCAIRKRVRPCNSASPRAPSGLVGSGSPPTWNRAVRQVASDEPILPPPPPPQPPPRNVTSNNLPHVEANGRPCSVPPDADLCRSSRVLGSRRQARAPLLAGTWTGPLAPRAAISSASKTPLSIANPPRLAVGRSTRTS